MRFEYQAAGAKASAINFNCFERLKKV